MISSSSAGRHQNSAQEPVHLRRHSLKDTVSQEIRSPLSDHRSVDCAERDPSKPRTDQAVELPPIQANGRRPHARALGDPAVGLGPELDLRPLRICPLSTDDLRLDQGEPAVGIPLRSNVDGGVPAPVRPGVRRLVAARVSTPDVAETWGPITVGHHTTPCRSRHTSAAVIGSSRRCCAKDQYRPL